MALPSQGLVAAAAGHRPDVYYLLAATDDTGLPDAAVHAVDGDGESLCGRVSAAELRPIDGTFWEEIPRDRRCRRCQLLMTSYGMGHV